MPRLGLLLVIAAGGARSVDAAGFCSEHPDACSESAQRFCVKRPDDCRARPVMTCDRFPKLCATVNGRLGPDLAQLGARLELALTTTPPLVPSQQLTFTWKLHNTTPIAINGRLRLLVDAQDRPTALPIVAALPANQSLDGFLQIGPYAPGTHIFTIEFQLQTGERWDTVGPTGLLHRAPTYDTIGSAEVSVTVADPNSPLSFDCPTDKSLDLDADCLDDRLEHALLERYTPYYKFSMEAENREILPPTDIACFLMESELVRGGETLVPISTLRSGDYRGLLDQPCPAGAAGCSPDVLQNPMLTDYEIHRLHDSCAWSDAANRKTGLYGHVVPYDQLSAQGEFQRFFDDPAKLFEGDPALGRQKRFVKVEYWQFFGQNGWSFPHQGDWTTVELLLDLGARDVGLTTTRPCSATPPPSLDLPRDSPLRAEVAAVLHYAHGKVEFRFDLDGCTGAHPTDDPSITELRGPSYSRPECPGVGPDFLCEDDNAVQFFKVGTEPMATHPVVYLEFATHEYFPTGAWMNYIGMPNHAGTDEDHRYLTATPPNLGEVGAPLGETALAPFILRFNGKWGTDPRGPSLHAEWTWPSDSKVRSKLSDLPP